MQVGQGQEVWDRVQRPLDKGCTLGVDVLGQKRMAGGDLRMREYGGGCFGQRGGSHHDGLVMQLGGTMPGWPL